MGWSWAAACGVQGRGHIARLPAQLVISLFAYCVSHSLSLRLLGLLSSGLADIRMSLPDFIGAIYKHGGGGGDNWSYKTCNC